MRGAVPRSADGALLTIRDDAQALSSRDLGAQVAPRILGAFQEPARGESVGRHLDPVSTPRTDRNDAMRIRGQVADTGWARTPGKREVLSIFERWSR